MTVQNDLRDFRKKAYAISPYYGQGVDHLILQGLGLSGASTVYTRQGGFGLLDVNDPTSPNYIDPTFVDTSVTNASPGSITGVLNSLATGIKDVATAANLSVKNYFDAVTSVQTMAAANRAGLTVDQYTGIKNNSISTARAATSPLLWLGGAGLIAFLLLRK